MRSSEGDRKGHSSYLPPSLTLLYDPRWWLLALRVSLIKGQIYLTLSPPKSASFAEKYDSETFISVKWTEMGKNC